MPRIFVNDVPQTVEMPMPTWGDLLASLDERAGGEGLLVTTARFDGVEEPSFRDDAVTARRLGDIGRVDVETATPSAFLRGCLLDSIGSLEQAVELTGRLSAIYRRHDVSPGHEGLTTLAGDLRGLTSLVSMLAGPLQIDLSSCAGDGTTIAQRMDELAGAIHALVTAQTSDDWLTVADVLEYDLEPAIHRWIALLKAVAHRL